jgi:hypothetical protein
LVEEFGGDLLLVTFELSAKEKLLV